MPLTWKCFRVATSQGVTRGHKGSQGVTTPLHGWRVTAGAFSQIPLPKVDHSPPPRYHLRRRAAGTIFFAGVVLGFLGASTTGIPASSLSLSLCNSTCSVWLSMVSALFSPEASSAPSFSAPPSTIAEGAVLTRSVVNWVKQAIPSAVGVSALLRGVDVRSGVVANLTFTSTAVAAETDSTGNDDDTSMATPALSLPKEKPRVLLGNSNTGVDCV